MSKSSSASRRTVTSSNLQSLKQGTLSFTSAKRANSTPNGKPQQKTPVTEKEGGKRVETIAEARNDAKPVEIFDISDEDGSTLAEIIAPVKRTRANTRVQTPSGIMKSPPSQQSRSEKHKSFPGGIGREHLDVEDRAGRYRKYYHEVRSKMGCMEPIHSEGQNKIHQMLRFFDMSYEFGPCIGMTRLERWERAEALGLNPPVEVRDILLTKEGMENTDYAQCVLNDEV